MNTRAWSSLTSRRRQRQPSRADDCWRQRRAECFVILTPPSLILVVVGLVLVLVGVAVQPVDADQWEYKLVNDLLRDYDSSIRPSIHHNSTLNVTFGLALAQIIDVDERNMIITTNCWLNQGWIDYKLKWKPEDYDGIEFIHIPFDKIWRPDILLVNNADSWARISSISTNAIVKHDGNVTWLSTVIFKSSCSINVRFFPFDEQQCDMIFASWTFDGYFLDIDVNSNEGDVTNYIKNGEWHLVKLMATKILKKYSCCEEPYPEIYYRLIMRRRPLFYVFNMVFPCMLITLVAFLGFYLPPGSSEKVSIGITTLLSITVFLMLVAESMPPTSEQLPLLGIYYAVTIGIVSFSTTMAVITLNVNNKGMNGRRVPRVVRFLFFRILARVLCTELSAGSKTATTTTTITTTTTPPMTSTFYKSIFEKTQQQQQQEQQQKQQEQQQEQQQQQQPMINLVYDPKYQETQSTSQPNAEDKCSKKTRHHKNHQRHRHHHNHSKSTTYPVASSSVATATRHSKQRDYYFGPSPIIKHNRRKNMNNENNNNSSIENECYESILLEEYLTTTSGDQATTTPTPTNTYYVYPPPPRATQASASNPAHEYYPPTTSSSSKEKEKDFILLRPTNLVKSRSSSEIVMTAAAAARTTTPPPPSHLSKHRRHHHHHNQHQHQHQHQPHDHQPKCTSGGGSSKLALVEFVVQLERVLDRQFGPLVHKLTETLRQNDTRLTQRHTQERIENEWADVARVSDHFFCYFFPIMTLAICAYIFGMSPYVLTNW